MVDGLPYPRQHLCRGRLFIGVNHTNEESMHKRILVTGLVIIASVTGCATIVVEAVRPNMGGAGVCYALPKTVIHVALKADMTTLKAAPYQKFAPIFAPG